MNAPTSLANNVSFAVVGTGGAGAITAGSILLEAAGKTGWHGLLNRSVGPQIRGGEAAALVRLSTRPAACMSKVFDIVINVLIDLYISVILSFVKSLGSLFGLLMSNTPGWVNNQPRFVLFNMFPGILNGFGPLDLN